MNGSYTTMMTAPYGPDDGHGLLDVVPHHVQLVLRHLTALRTHTGLA
jgi:hypothetical protein